MSHPLRPPTPPQQQQKLELPIPFPFQPYPAQKALMQQLYQTLDTGHVGLFESPTGTGKSLSLICAGLYWLKERQRKDDAGEDDPVAASSSSTCATTDTTIKAAAEPDWLRDYDKDKERTAAAEKRGKVCGRRQALRLRLEEARHASHRLSALRPERRPGSNDDGRTQHNKKRSGTGKGCKTNAKDKEDMDEEEDSDLLPAEYESSKESDDDSDEDTVGAGLNKKDEKEEEEGEELDRSTMKILYCSRTHSQLSQFVMEIQKTAFKDNTRVISLSSRKNLCINDDVLKLGSDGRISDRCLDMQKTKMKKPTAATLATSLSAGPNDPTVMTSKKRTRAPPSSKQTTKCPFLPSDGVKQQTLYRDHALSQIRNLEDLAELGKKLGTCSYYGTRRALAQAEVICMPYATLLHKGTRESMKIPLKGNVVLVDEAHNLVEAINAIHSSQLSLQAMSRALVQVTLYWERYNTRLSGKNAVYVQQIIRILKGLVDVVRAKAYSGGATSGWMASGATATADDEAVSTIIMSVNELVFEADMDNVNLFKLVRYMEQSQIAKKVLGFADRRLGEVQIHRSESESGSTLSSSVIPSAAAGAPEDADENAEYVSSHISSLQTVQTFLTTLTGSNQDGRIVLETGHGPQRGRKRPAAGLKYIMLNAAVHFRKIVAEARSVVLVGGTMRPVAPIVAQLFPDLSASQLDVFSCGHVIPPENLTSLCVSKGPTGVGFDFTHKSRVLPEQMDELGRLLLNVCTIIPGGVVVFFPSYGYEEMVVRRWRETGLMSKLQTKKATFTEPKRAKDVDAVLQAFSAAIVSNPNHDDTSKGNSRSCGGGGGGGGAILFCVVGAKMSEGINFADDMARCVVMVGLPYPDRRDPELQQKLQYLDSLQSSQGGVPCSCSESSWEARGGGAFGPMSGKSYYQNLCMRAVNQSIGRAIRHANDWAAIVLVDRRYIMDPSIFPLLPKWIADRVVPHQQSLDFRQVFVHLSQFVRNKAEGRVASEKE
ncbi:atp-dependent rna helicase ddx11-like protein 8-like [Nannochloropsis oceanica]